MFLYLFDLPRYEGEDLRALPLRERKARLRRALDFGGPLRFNPHRNGEHGEELFREACKKGLEGVIAKRADSPYRSGGRSRDWLKLKCHAEQELVIGGYTAPKGSRTEFGALLVGYYDDERDAALRRQGRHRLRPAHAEGARRAPARARAGRVAVRALQADPAGHALGAPGAGGADRLRRVDARRPPAPPALPRPARRQARARGGRGSGRRERARSPTRTRCCSRTTGSRRPTSRDYYERVAEWMLPHVKRPAGEHAALPRRHRRQGLLPQGHPGLLPDWIRRVEVPKASGTRDPRGDLRRRHARLPGGPEHDHAARVALARRPRLAARPARDRPRPASGRRLRRGPARRAPHGRADARAGVLAVRAGHGLEGHPRVDAAAPPRRTSRRCARSRATSAGCSPRATRTS